MNDCLQKVLHVFVEESWALRWIWCECLQSSAEDTISWLSHAGLLSTRMWFCSSSIPTSQAPRVRRHSPIQRAWTYLYLIWIASISASVCEWRESSQCHCDSSLCHTPSRFLQTFGAVGGQMFLWRWQRNFSRLAEMMSPHDRQGPHFLYRKATDFSLLPFTFKFTLSKAPDFFSLYVDFEIIFLSKSELVVIDDSGSRIR